MKEIYGYKTFNENLINNYGVQFEVGKTYHKDGDIKYGTCGNGFHFCKNLEDTLRYFDGFNDNIKICKVRGFGEVVECFDDYNEYYEMYSSSDIEILQIMTRKEIIYDMLNVSNEHRVIRFITGYKLNTKEIALLADKWKNSYHILNSIEYYQFEKGKTLIKR